LEAALRRGPAAARVDSVSVDSLPAETGPEGFEIH
jgi:hypothetical protein